MDSVVDHPPDCFKALPLVWDVEGFKDVREGGVVTTDPTDGSLQVKKALLLRLKKNTDEDKYSLWVECSQCSNIIFVGREPREHVQTVTALILMCKNSDSFI